MRLSLRHVAAVGALLLHFVANCFAAPPKFQYMIPSGAQAGTTVDLEVHAFDGWPVQVWVDRPGLTLSFKEKKNEAVATVAPDAIPGVYWLRFYDKEGATTLVPFVVGHLPEVAEQEPNNAPTKPQPLSGTPIVVNGRIERRDTDIFGIHLDKGETLVADIDSRRTLASPMDGVLEIVSSAGFVLAQNDDDQGIDPRIVFVAPESGTFLVRVFGFPAMPDSSIELAGGRTYLYRLTLATEGFVDYVLPMAVSASTERVEVKGWNIPAEAASLIPTPLPDSGRVALFHPRLANVPTLPFVPHASILAVEPSQPEHPQPIELPVTITGRIETPRDKDNYLFKAKAGATLHVRVESRAIGYPLDAVLELFDAQGKSLSRLDDVGDNRDTELTFAVPADGSYRLAISDLHRQGGPRFVYRLTAVIAQPDFAISVASDTFVVAAGQKLELPVTVERQHGFNEPIAVQLEGLSNGTSAESVTSSAEGESAKAVKLVVAAGAAPFSGPIRVIGAAADGTNGVSSRTHVATAPLAERTDRTSHLWLTVSEPPKK